MREEEAGWTGIQFPSFLSFFLTLASMPNPLTCHLPFTHFASPSFLHSETCITLGPDRQHAHCSETPGQAQAHTSLSMWHFASSLPPPGGGQDKTPLLECSQACLSLSRFPSFSVGGRAVLLCWTTPRKEDMVTVEKRELPTYHLPTLFKTLCIWLSLAFIFGNENERGGGI